MVIVAGILVALAAGHSVRGHLDFASTPASIQTWVASLGWWGPVFYVLVFVGRQFLFLPAGLLLPVAGVCFGAWAGTALATLAIIASGLTKFGLARAMRRGYREGDPTNPGRVGPAMVSLATAHPLGPLSWSHWAAGFSSIRLGAFAVALALGAPVRAFAMSYLGSTLVQPHAMNLMVMVGALLAIVTLPVLHPGVRRRLPLPR